MRSLACIDDDDTVAMLDGPGISWQPIGPVSVGEDGELPRQAMSTACNLCRLDPDRTGLDGMDLGG